MSQAGREDMLFEMGEGEWEKQNLSPYAVFKERVSKNNKDKSSQEKPGSYWSLLVWCSLFNLRLLCLTTKPWMDAMRPQPQKGSQVYKGSCPYPNSGTSRVYSDPPKYLEECKIHSEDHWVVAWMWFSNNHKKGHLKSLLRSH